MTESRVRLFLVWSFWGAVASVITLVALLPWVIAYPPGSTLPPGLTAAFKLTVGLALGGFLSWAFCAMALDFGYHLEDPAPAKPSPEPWCEEVSR